MNEQLIALAEAHGISASHWSFFGQRVAVPEATLRALLAALGVRADGEEAVQHALSEAEAAPWRSLLPPSLVSRPGERAILAHVRDGHELRLSVTLENGEHRELAIPEQQPECREVDGILRWRVVTPLPIDLPLGWHTLHAREARGGELQRTASATLAIVPERLPAPPARAEKGGRSWGLMAQLYSARSQRSWGIGDLADLADLAAIAGEQGADFVLLNPLHAGDIIPPIEPSPYLPSSRRFLSPLYLRPEHILEFAYLPEEERARVLSARDAVAAANSDPERLDRDSVWAAKRTALQAIFSAGRSPARQAEFDTFLSREGPLLIEFANWCAEQEGDAGGAGFHAWLQWILDEQARQAQSAALASGMRIGVMHDLAVGVDPHGFDARVFAEAYARGLSVGAPPDMYNSNGQNWSQPPWSQRALTETGYAPLREMLRGLLRHSGALRVDHVAGFFRLWCIPEGSSAADGAYLRYDHDAMLGVLCLEAMRAGAVVIGEDLGTIEPWVREALAARGILGTSVLWFERDGEGLIPPERYRREVLATVTTHDLPPTAGYLTDEHLITAERLGLLSLPPDEARNEAERAREQALALIRERELLEVPGTEHAGPAGEQETVEALHRLIAQSPALLLGISLADAVGERRAQNVPGTHREYPNWQLPLADPEGRAILLDQLRRNRRFLSLTRAVDTALHAGGW